VRLPPLRERREDIPLLAEHFVARVRDRVPGSPVQALTPEALRLLEEHSWPGNVRELEHVIEGAVVTGSAASVGPRDLEASLAVITRHPLDRARRDLVPLRELEQEYINWVLERTGGNKTRAAEILGIDPSTLYRREVRGKA
jgi:two-component system, NtrC family, response regulator HydG